MSHDFTADSFRRWGHLQAQLDDLGRMSPQPHRDIDNAPDADKWREIYCGPIGAEFMHIPYPERCDWIAKKLEEPGEQILEKKFVLERLMKAELFEKFIHTRYVGNKRFSLDGLAVMIPALDCILTAAAEQGFELAMIGMSHRGRLNTMVNIVGVDPANIFANFEDVDPKSVLGSGDVKYHKGATGRYRTPLGKDIVVHLASNPSHLEAVNPVILGRVKAKQRRLKDSEKKKALAIVLHGDAAFAGQGINAETLNFMDLPGFRVGGCIHLVINNLIGFTAVPESFNSTRYCTDVAKRLPIPIFHVNGEKPDAVMQVSKLAMDYRSEFSSDVVLDLIGYRRYGHSEIDDPTLTLPLLYDRIAEHPWLYEAYAKEIGLSDDELKKLEADTVAYYDSELEKGRAITKHPSLATFPEYWETYVGEAWHPEMEVNTAISAEQAEQIAQSITTFPESFNLHHKLKRGFDQRLQMGQGKKPIDWGMAEQLAFGSLLLEGTPVRITGQDSCRGTFSHRQAVVVDTQTGERYFPLNHLAKEQGEFEVYDSMLSEAAALGFEYGFSRDYPEALVLWEAQFGDFANGGQIIIDQFITAAEDKWQLLSGLVLLLPHGYEGQGPEHSSARVERFLQLAGEENIQVVYPSTAAQYFHVLRRQALRKWRKPLVIFTPKSMLRTPAAASLLERITNDKFHLVLGDTEEVQNPYRLLLCSGKIVHELRAARKKQGKDDVVIASLEQLYPFPEQDIRALIGSYPSLKSIVWVQEEPANMGALSFVRPLLERLSGGIRVSTVRRSTSASPATGSPKAHAMEQDALLRLAFANPSK